MHIKVYKSNKVKITYNLERREYVIKMSLKYYIDNLVAQNGGFFRLIQIASYLFVLKKSCIDL